ncbi:hypothetical protein AB0K51_31490 [Kitasatospora sp. NPDC049285]|uniref:hypothetical protein n=1 Tax=Kitasatospora sp. NPDC049285 TaxID=3157096 RepID=UPI003441DDDE
MRKIFGATIAGLALAAGTLMGAGSASASTSDTYLPGGDYLETSISAGGWSGQGGTSCATVQSNVHLYGNNPFYAQNINNTTTLDAYGYHPVISWRGMTRSGGTVDTSVTDSYHNSYDWRSDMGGAACINTTAGSLTGVARGEAYVPSQGGWYYANASF